jgi:hypothetical protein
MTPPRPLLGWRNSEPIGLKPKPTNLSGVTRLQFSRKLGCAACTKCPDSHPKPGRLGSSNMSALHTRERVRRRRGLVHSSGGRSQSRLRTMYQLPTHQQRRRLRPHSLQPHSGVHTPDKDDTPAVARRQRHRAKTKFLTLDAIDGRTLAAQRARALVARIEADVGLDLSEAEKQLAQRAGVLGAFLEDVEAKWLRGRSCDVLHRPKRAEASVGNARHQARAARRY